MRIASRAFLLIALFAVSTSCTPPSKPVSPADDIRFPLPDFKLTERSGKTVTKADLAGKVWVASFVFTRCPGPCPAVTATVARLQADLAADPNVQFVTFTVDPERDDPAELRKYADRYRADPEKWFFLTGKEADIHTLMTEGFKVGVVKKPDAKPGDEFDHSTRLVVVDKSGVARGYYDGMAADHEGGKEQFEDGLRALKAKVAALESE
jgi:cytochrome oxidase Cu insertion factor (SCO1/SenC/PrrC family)